MDFKFNPQQAYADMLSGQRNMFITTALGVTILSLSEKIKGNNMSLIMNLLGGLIVAFSMFIGIRTTNEFDYLIETYKHSYSKNHSMDKYEKLVINRLLSNLGHWKWANYAYIVLFTTLALSIIIMKRRKMNFFGNK